jgi:hypothetical protein
MPMAGKTANIQAHAATPNKNGTRRCRLVQRAWNYLRACLRRMPAIAVSAKPNNTSEPGSGTVPDVDPVLPEEATQLADLSLAPTQPVTLINLNASA